LSLEQFFCNNFFLVVGLVYSFSFQFVVGEVFIINLEKIRKVFEKTRRKEKKNQSSGDFLNIKPNVNFLGR
jgi:predicted RND superfamily exporter protein